MSYRDLMRQGHRHERIPSRDTTASPYKQGAVYHLCVTEYCRCGAWRRRTHARDELAQPLRTPSGDLVAAHVTPWHQPDRYGKGKRP